LNCNDSGVRSLTGSYPEWTTGHLPAAAGGSVRESGDSTRHLTHKASRGGAMAFIQIIEVTTTRPEEIQELVEEWSARTEGRRSAYRSTLTADRDRPGTYVQIVEFPSYQQAMANSGLPETGEFAEKLARLCDGPPVFRNLDVRRVNTFS
jgi:hypothetical protein